MFIHKYSFFSCFADELASFFVTYLPRRGKNLFTLTVGIHGYFLPSSKGVDKQHLIHAIISDLYSGISSCTMGAMSFTNPAVKNFLQSLLSPELWLLLPLLLLVSVQLLLTFKLSGSLW